MGKACLVIEFEERITQKNKVIYWKATDQKAIDYQTTQYNSQGQILNLYAKRNSILVGKLLEMYCVNTENENNPLGEYLDMYNDDCGMFEVIPSYVNAKENAQILGYTSKVRLLIDKTSEDTKNIDSLHPGKSKVIDRVPITSTPKIKARNR